MKNLILICLALGISYSTQAKAESTEDVASMDCFKNMDQKLASLESYSVTYVEAKNEKTVMKASTAKQRSPDSLQVKLIRAKKKI